MHISFCKTLDEAKAALADGAIPVECSFGHIGSVVDPRYVMDHHGDYSHQEGVALRAYRDFFGALRSEFLAGTVRFAVTGAADADACFALASLIGELPHPSRAGEFSKAPGFIQSAMTRDLMSLATLVNAVDVNPIGIRLEETLDGCMLLLWNQMSSSVQDAAAFHAGVDRWRALLAHRAPTILLNAVKEEEADRVRKAREAKVTRISEHVAFIESEVWGYDVWYADHAPCIVAQTANGNATVGCPSNETAERLFGAGGLKNVFPRLVPDGWGGRESIGGSPRGMVLTREQALDAARLIDSLRV
jgi:hypothetical protein